MAQLKRKDIYEGGNPFEDIQKALNELIKAEQELKKQNDELIKSYRNISKDNTGKSAKELIQYTEKQSVVNAKLETTQKALTALEKERLSIEQKTKKIFVQTLAASEKRNKTLLKGKELLKEKNKKIREEIQLEKALKQRLDEEGKTIADLQRINKNLIIQRKNLNLTTEEGKKRYEELTKAIKGNEDKLKDFDKEIGRNQRNVGNYASAFDALSGGLGSAVSGMWGMVKASLAFIATPIGAVLAAIVGVIKLFKSAIDRSLGSQEKLNKITGRLSGLFNLVLDALTPLVNFILDNVLEAFDSLGKAAGYVIEKLVNWGIISENTSKKIKKSTNEQADATDRLATSERELIEARIKFERLQLDYQNREEKLRQIRDDETLSIDKRIKANEQLGVLLKKQLQKELELAQKVLALEKLKQKVYGETPASIQAIGEAENKVFEIRERITGQESEQLTNRNALLKEKAKIDEENAKKEFLRQESLTNVTLQNVNVRLKTETDAQNEIAKRDEKLKKETVKRTEEQLAKEEALKQAAFEKDKARQQANTEAWEQLASDSINTMFAMFTQVALMSDAAKKEVGDYNQQILLMALDTTAKIIELAIAQIIAKELGEKSFVGIATAAVLTGIVEGAFQAAKANILANNKQQYAEGGEVHGAGTSTSDSIDAKLSNGEFVVKASAYKDAKILTNAINKGYLKDSNFHNIKNTNNLNDLYLRKIATNTANNAYTYEKEGFIYVVFANGSTKKILK